MLSHLLFATHIIHSTDECSAPINRLFVSLKYPISGNLNQHQKKRGREKKQSLPPGNPRLSTWSLFIQHPHDEHSTTKLDNHPPVTMRAIAFLCKTRIETADHSESVKQLFYPEC